jgi:hypothetical protein
MWQSQSCTEGQFIVLIILQKIKMELNWLRILLQEVETKQQTIKRK